MLRSWPGLIVLILASIALIGMVSRERDNPPILSRWGPPVGAAVDTNDGVGLRGEATLATAAINQLETFNAASDLQEDVAGGSLRFYRRGMAGGGELAYFVVMLGDPIHIEVINADGALPTSDATGNTIWADGQQHLQRVAEMASAAHARREGMVLIGATAFGFHGAERTSNEGTVVINRTIHRINPGRSALCLTNDGRAWIGLFDEKALYSCDQAIGAGPIILWESRIVHPDIEQAEGELLPFNPLGEDFVLIEWRRKIYRGLYPKTAACIGQRPDGRAFLVLATSERVSGPALAYALRDMGCHTALGGDDDTSTQAVWRGQPVWERQPRPVPDAIGVYVHDNQ
jgi:hypothetical protein